MQNIQLSTQSTRYREIPKSVPNAQRPANLPTISIPWIAQTTILDPRSEFVTKWNNIFLLACISSLFLDPFYFFIPRPCGPGCFGSNVYLQSLVTVLRLVADSFYLFHIITKFRTAYVNPNSRVFGRGELVMDPKKIAIRYLKSDFVVDVAAMLPLPQLLIWIVIPALKNKSDTRANHTLSLVVLVQYVPRILVMFPLNSKIINSTGVVARTPWSGAAYNFLMFILASHVLGAVWYLWSIQRLYTCWTTECAEETRTTHIFCDPIYFDKTSLSSPAAAGRGAWLNATHVLSNCNPRNSDLDFKFGLFGDAFLDDVPDAGLIQAYFYCLWWGMRNLCSYGQNLKASTYVGETLFCSFICVMGLGLFSHLIGQVQNYLQSIMVRIEEWRIKRRDTEEWMNHRQLPEDLKQRIRHFVQYKWLATRGVDEEEILQSLPLDLRREIQRHLCLGLVRRVPFFAQMDNQLLDAICERLVPSLNTKDTYIIREDDPVTEMIFIIRGQLESSTTYGGRSGFYNSITLRPGDFCGEELLTWALLPTSTLNLPTSTRTAKALTEVEAFALRADDLKYVATQFKRLNSKKLQHAFRYYSHQWRTWGACFIQAAWRRFKKRKLAEELARNEEYWYYDYDDDEEVGDEDQPSSSSSRQPLLIDLDEGSIGGSIGGNNGDSAGGSHHPQPLNATILASRFAANTRRGATHKVKIDPSDKSLKMPKMFKPEDPDLLSDI